MSEKSYSPPPEPNPEESYEPAEPSPAYAPSEPTPPPPSVRRLPWWYYLVILLLFLVGILIGTRCRTTVEVPVTRIVEVTSSPGPTVTAGPSTEVTRIVPVTTVITQTVEVTPAEPVTTVVVETVESTREVEVTRIVPVTTVVTDTVEIARVVTRLVELPPPTPEYGGQGCTRFDLETGRNRFDGTPADGTYYLVESPFDRDVNVIASWEARQSDLDSGWIENVRLSAETVHVQAWFYPASYGLPILLEIVNHAPGTPYGWLANGICHAVEIQFPADS